MPIYSGGIILAIIPLYLSNNGSTWPPAANFWTAFSGSGIPYCCLKYFWNSSTALPLLPLSIVRLTSVGISGSIPNIDAALGPIPIGKSIGRVLSASSNISAPADPKICSNKAPSILPWPNVSLCFLLNFLGDIPRSWDAPPTISSVWPLR